MWEVILSIVLLVVGMFFLIKGADWFVEGAAAIARSFHIPSLVIGLTLVSIGTSMPEFSVSLTSSLQGLNDMSFGNIIGSNIFNTFVVIGVSACLTPLVVSKDMQKYDLPILVGIYTILAIFAFVISPNVINLWESIIIFSLTIFYTLFLILRSRKQPQVEEETKKRKWWINVILVIVGLAGIILGGNLVVNNASSIAMKLGMSELLVGLTIVAVGTSLPELVTSIIAARKNEGDIAIGNVIGSSIGNIGLILGIAGVIKPAQISNSILTDTIILFAATTFFTLFLAKKKETTKTFGIILIVIYILYLAFAIVRNYCF